MTSSHAQLSQRREGPAGTLNQTANVLPPSCQFLPGTLWSGNKTSSFLCAGPVGPAVPGDRRHVCSERQVCKHAGQVRARAAWPTAALFLISLLGYLVMFCWENTCILQKLRPPPERACCFCTLSLLKYSDLGAQMWSPSLWVLMAKGISCHGIMCLAISPVVGCLGHFSFSLYSMQLLWYLLGFFPLELFSCSIFPKVELVSQTVL